MHTHVCVCVCVCVCVPSPSEGVCVRVNAHTGMPTCAGAVPDHRQDHMPSFSDLRCVCVSQVQVQGKVFVYVPMLTQAFPDVQERCLTKDKVTSLLFLT